MYYIECQILIILTFLLFQDFYNALIKHTRFFHITFTDIFTVYFIGVGLRSCGSFPTWDILCFYDIPTFNRSLFCENLAQTIYFSPLGSWMVTSLFSFSFVFFFCCFVFVLIRYILIWTMTCWSLLVCNGMYNTPLYFTHTQTQTNKQKSSLDTKQETLSKILCDYCYKNWLIYYTGIYYTGMWPLPTGTY